MGRRQYSPKKVMDTMATYYENLYKVKPTRNHPIHEHVQSQTMQYLKDKNADEEWYNSSPTERQILEIIENKKCGVHKRLESSTQVINSAFYTGNGNH